MPFGSVLQSLKHFEGRAWLSKHVFRHSTGRPVTAGAGQVRGRTWHQEDPNRRWMAARLLQANASNRREGREPKDSKRPVFSSLAEPKVKGGRQYRFVAGDGKAVMDGP